MTPFGPDHESWADSTGAYLLSALPDDERDGFERHLASCDFCREEVEFLRAASDALPRAVPQVAPPPDLRSRIMAVVDRDAELLRAAEAPAPARRPARVPWHRRFGLLWARPAMAAWAIALLLAGGLGGVLLAGGSGDDTRTIAGTAPTKGTEVRLVVTDGQGRLEVDHLPPPPAGRVYQVWVKRPGRDPEPTPALFVPSDAGAAVAGVPGSLEGAESVLVTDEPEGGSETPTGTLAASAPVRSA